MKRAEEPQLKTVELEVTGLEIAIIGMAGRFPGANNIEDFWDNLKKGVESIGFFSGGELEEAGVEPGQSNDTAYVKVGSIIERADYFDASFFGYTPREARIMPPQVRIFHSVAWEALEDAGIAPDTYDGRIGLYAGASSSTYWEALTFLEGAGAETDDFTRFIFTDKDSISTHIAFQLNLKGPAVVVQTACSTSLVAVHLAVQGLLNGESEVALAGGVTISPGDKGGYFYQEGMIMSKDGHVRTFDANASGMVGGNGAAVVVLKTLEDAVAQHDHIYALIKGSAINNDGTRKVGYTAPSVKGQAEVIKAAQYLAGVGPKSIGYIEAHGTATALGDSVEIEALAAAFKTSKHNFCAIGSVKTNVGHLDNASGAAGLIKAALALYHKFLPPSLHYETPNPHIDFKNSPFYVVTAPGAWKPHDPRYPLRAGVSSFGIGGTNAHVILEEAPVEIRDNGGTRGLAPLPGENGPGQGRGGIFPPGQSREYQLIVLSAGSETALEKMSRNLANHLQMHPGLNLADVAYTLQKGRKTFPYKCMLVCSPHGGVEAAAALLDPSASTVHTHIPAPGEENREIRVVFMFPGLGSQYVDMGRDLYEHEPLFRSEMDRCFEILKPLVEDDIKEILYPGISVSEVSEVSKEYRSPDNRSHRSHTSYKSYKSHINQAEIASVVIFIFEYALAKLLMKWGIQPDIMMGYSFGEYTAACISGVFSLEDALQLVVRRGRLLKKIPDGVMLSIPLRREELNPLLPRGMALAIDNGSSCIAAGEPGAAAALEEEMKRRGYLTLRLPVEKAIHSQMVEPILKEFQQMITGITRRKPRIPYISNVTGTRITERQAGDPGYWADHLRKTVRFSKGMEKLVKDPGTVLVEVGPGNELTALLARFQEKENRQAINLVKPRNKPVSDRYHLLNRLGRLWFMGVSIDWDKLYLGQRPYRVSLPTYPFEEQRYYLDPGLLSRGSAGWKKGFQGRGKNDIAHWFYVPSWKRLGLSSEEIGNMPVSSCWLVFLDTCGLGDGLVKLLEKNGQRVITVRIGEEFKKENSSQFSLHPDHAYENDYNALFVELCRMEAVPDRIVHLWSVTGPDQPAAMMDMERLNQVKNRGYYSLEGIARALGRQDITRDIQLLAISDYLHEVTGEDGIYPEKAMILGQVMVIPTEFDHIKCRSIDLVLPSSGITCGEQGEKLVRQLLDELISGAEEPVVAYRGGYRWVQCFEPRPLESPGEKSLRLKPGGVYLVTGGLGGVGLVMAEYLAKKLGAALILTGRTGLPPREQWEQVIASTPPHEGIGLQIRKVKEIEEMGAKLLVLRADAAEPGQMQEVVTRAQQQLGPISGIIHCAALTDGQMIQRRTRETSERIFSSKVTGTLVLDALFKDKALDFFVLCSSLSSVLPAFGQAGYCAANAFLNAFALRRNATGSTTAANRLTVAIAWDRWLGIGSSVMAEKRHSDITGEKLTEGMSGEQGMAAFNRILANPFPGVLISISDLRAAFKNAYRYQGSFLKARWEKANTLKTAVPRPRLDTPYRVPENNTQQIMVNIWSTFFGYETVGIQDDFFELGGDSLKAIILTGMLHKAFNTKINLVDFFNMRTIKELSGYITRNEGKDRFTSIEPVEEMEYYHLTSAQKRLYILQQMNPDSTAYNMPTIIPLSVEFDPEKIGETFQGIIKRHESLRTSFHLVNDMPVQRIHDHVEFEIDKNFAELFQKRLPEGPPEAIIKSCLCPFDLSFAPLLRVGLVKNSDGSYLLVVDMHHIISDGVSHQVLGKDFLALHQGEDLSPLRVRYKDFSGWQQGEKEQESLKQQEKYWLKAFAGEIPVLELPTDYPRPAEHSFEGNNIDFQIPAEAAQAIKTVALRRGATLFMVLTAAFNILLSKLTGQEDIVIATPAAGRRHAELEEIIGMFVNTLALRSYPAGERTFAEYLDDLKETVLKAFENQDYPFEELVEKLPLTRNIGRNPLFDIVFVMQNMEIGTGDRDKPTGNENPRPKQPGKPGEFENTDPTTKFDITLTAVERNQELKLTFQYCTQLFKKETIERYIIYFKKILATAVENPGIKLRELEIITEADKKRLMNEIDETGAGNPAGRTNHRLYEEYDEEALEVEFDF
jgi:acyl transferase domain-containing protein/NAD(P)-dependent dehydrogenase (short-subunit alcohol dehydrogenase family)/acyl carrier protein